AAEWIGRQPTGAQPAPEEEREEQHDRSRADHSELLGDDRVDEVGVGIGQEVELLHALARPQSEDPSGADRYQRLERLETAAQRILVGIEEGEKPRAPVGRDED